MNRKMTSLADLVAACETALQSDDSINEMMQIIQSFLLLPTPIRDDILAHQGDTPFASLYTTEAIDIRVITLAPFFQTCPHDHNTWSIVGVIEGAEHNIFYRETVDYLTEKSADNISLGECFFMSEDTIHALHNKLPTTTRSIHIYGADVTKSQKYMWDPMSETKLAYSPEGMHALSQRVSAASSANNP